ncbi:hypothetical protein M8J77_025269 [Diaphorina citri]|nr:hypothetical protein M8J77_025269 [Diaphorina citri]
MTWCKHRVEQRASSLLIKEVTDSNGKELTAPLCPYTQLSFCMLKPPTSRSKVQHINHYTIVVGLVSVGITVSDIKEYHLNITPDYSD